MPQLITTIAPSLNSLFSNKTRPNKIVQPTHLTDSRLWIALKVREIRNRELMNSNLVLNKSALISILKRKLVLPVSWDKSTRVLPCNS